MLVVLPAGRQAMAADSAASLIEAVSRAASNAGMWEAEGRLVTQESADEGSLQTEASFRVVIERVPVQRARIEITDVPAPVVRVCDGSLQWGYRPAAKQFWTLSYGKIDVCAEPFDEWPDLAADLHEAVITGQDQLHIGERVTDCAVVSGDYAGINAGHSGKRTVWIDIATKTIWQYRVERGAIGPAGGAVPAVRVYTLLRQTSDGVRRPGDFVFQLPDEYVKLSHAPALRLGDGALLHVTAPVVLFKVEPVYTEEARRSHVEGTVVLSAEVWPDGAAHNFKVVRSLDPGLDQKAIEAVSQWKFKPGAKDGVPVSVAVKVEVNFVLVNRKK
jgi:TonB family protein